MCLAPRELWSIHQINVTMWSAHVSRVSGPRRWWSWWSWCSSGSGPASSSISGEHLSSNQSTSIQLPLSSGSIEPCHLFLYLKYKKRSWAMSKISVEITLSMLFTISIYQSILIPAISEVHIPRIRVEENEQKSFFLWCDSGEHFRWRKFSHLEPSHTYLPALASPAPSRLSSLRELPGTRANSLTLSSLGLLASLPGAEDRRKHSLMSAARSSPEPRWMQNALSIFDYV